MDLNQCFIEFLSTLGIKDYFGVTGGGLIQLLKRLPPYKIASDQEPRFYNLSEYAAGYAPLVITYPLIRLQLVWQPQVQRNILLVMVPVMRVL